MAQEIELKFIVNSDAVDVLRERLNTLGGRASCTQPVAEYLLRNAGCVGCVVTIWGLRIRGENGHYEMT